MAERATGPVRAVYEAGPTGFGLYRAARAVGIEIAVVAPSNTPRASGDRVKTDRKDAERLARVAMAGELSAVVVPDEFVEAARHLTRTREHARGGPVARAIACQSCCSCTGVSTTAQRRGLRRIGAGWPRRPSSTRRPSWPSWICWPPSTGASRARTRSMSASHGSPSMSAGGRRSRGCAPSAALTR